MARCFEESHLLYSRGDKAGAKTLSNEGKEHQQTMERLNKEASDWIFLGTYIYLLPLPVSGDATGLIRKQQGPLLVVINLNRCFNYFTG
jgi:hypothetical protein